MAREAVSGRPPPAYERRGGTSRQRTRVLSDAAALCGLAFPGLDLSTEINAVADHGYGDTLFLYDDGRMQGFAVCHYGAGSEGGSQALYIKFAQTLPGPAGDQSLARLLDACTDRAQQLGVKRVVVGVNTGRHRAYKILIDRGFRSELHGVRMHRPFVEIYDTDACFALDDWR